MDTESLRLVALFLAALWIAGALLALTGATRAGAYLNALVATAIGAATLPTIGATLIDRADYVERYGAAAMQHFPLAISVLCLSLVGLSLSLEALWHGQPAFVIGWFANAPVVGFAIYLAVSLHAP